VDRRLDEPQSRWQGKNFPAHTGTPTPIIQPRLDKCQYTLMEEQVIRNKNNSHGHFSTIGRPQWTSHSPIARPLTNKRIDKLNPWRRVLLAKPIATQFVHKFPAFYGPCHETDESSPYLLTLFP
jgi:hypothetical protein